MINLLNIRWRFLKSEQRIENELNFSRRTESLSIKAPLPQKNSENEISYEYIEGVDFQEYAENKPEDLKEKSSKIGDYISELRGNSIASGDMSPENFLISGDQIYKIDNEWANVSPEKFDYWLENVLLLVGLIILPRKSFKSALKGLNKSGFRGFSSSEILIGVVTGFLFASVFRRDLDYLRNFFHNLATFKL